MVDVVLGGGKWIFTFRLLNDFRRMAVSVSGLQIGCVEMCCCKSDQHHNS